MCNHKLKLLCIKQLIKHETTLTVRVVCLRPTTIPLPSRYIRADSSVSLRTGLEGSANARHSDLITKARFGMALDKSPRPVMMRHSRRLSDKLLLAFHQACDQGDVEIAWELLRITEKALLKSGQYSGPERRKGVESLVAAHERLFEIRLGLDRDNPKALVLAQADLD